MKRILCMSLIVMTLSVNAQNLQNAYKKSAINLTEVGSFGKNNDWDKIFHDFDKVEYNRPTGKTKHIVVAPDGSVFMSHKFRYSVSKFDKNGNYVKDFGKRGGKRASDFTYNPTVEGVLDGKYVYTEAVDGRMHFFDLDGNWVKTLRLDYMPLSTHPMKNGKIAILGHVPMGNASKQILSIYDTNTQKQKTLTSSTKSYAKQDESRIVINSIEYTDKDGNKQSGPTIAMSLPFADPFTSRERLATDSKGNLVVGYPLTGKIVAYSPDGAKVREFQVDIPDVGKISKEDMEGYYQKASKQLNEMEKTVNIDNAEYKRQYIAQYRSQLEKFRNPANYPSTLPYFAEMIIDSDDNILLFNFTKEEGCNKFDVFTYSGGGKKIGTSSFVSNDYKLSLSPPVFKFYKGQIIAYQELKNKKGNNMRLVKFDLK